MKIQVKNLGLLTEAEFEVADLTIICGGNNTGKTYATYALFGFLHTWREMVNIDIDSSIIETLLIEGSVSINIEKYVNISQSIVDDTCKVYIGELPRIFAASSAFFVDTDFKVMIDNSIAHLNSLRYEYSMESNGVEALSATKKEDELEIAITVLIPWEIPLKRLSKWIADIIQDLLFSELIPDTFIASVERTGISIFRKEIDSTRNELLERMFKIRASKEKLDVFRDGYQNYPLPIQVGLDFNRTIDKRNTVDSFITKEHPSILDDFVNIIGGEYNFNDFGELYYSPVMSSQMRLSIHESSSAVRSLLDLGFYLRYQARYGSLLIIDEPELNLHPENQRKIARLLARLVNIGIKVFITTHSDYIIKELNTLIMLNHEKPHLKKIAEEEGYKPEELISAERIKVYIAENSTLVPANIDPEMGIEARSFDTTIEDMNRIQEAIVWGEE
jgi:archaellum biogenesis ATPase FlaH